MTILLTLLLVFAYFFIRNVWFSNRKIEHGALIERVNLCIIHPDIILPEVEVHYKYYFGGGVYNGKGYALLSDFLRTFEYKIFFNQYLTPILQINDKMIVSEEHIEAFLLEYQDTVFIHLDPIEPYRSKLLETTNQSQDAKHKTQ
jgi:hypothetical protein